MRLPVEQFAKYVGVLSNEAFLDVVMQIEFDSSPFVYLWICLICDEFEDFPAKFWNFEVGTRTIYFSKNTFVLRTLAIEGRKC